MRISNFDIRKSIPSGLRAPYDKMNPVSETLLLDSKLINTKFSATIDFAGRFLLQYLEDFHFYTYEMTSNTLHIT